MTYFLYYWIIHCSVGDRHGGKGTHDCMTACDKHHAIKSCDEMEQLNGGSKQVRGVIGYPSEE